MFQARTAASDHAARAAFGGVRVRSWEYVEDPDTGTALGLGDYACDTRCTDSGYDILRWDGLVLGVDWHISRDDDSSAITLSNPGRSYLAYDRAGAPFVELTEAESRAALRAACEARIVRAWLSDRPDLPRITDPDDPSRVLDVDDIALPPAAPPAPPEPRRRGFFRRRHVSRPAPQPSPRDAAPHPSAPEPFREHPEPPRTHETARTLTLVDIGRTEAFDYVATESVLHDWKIEHTMRSTSRVPHVVCRASVADPAVGVVTSRLVTRSRPTIPPPPRGPRLTRWRVESDFSWAGIRVWLAPVPDAECPTFQITGLKEGQPTPEQLTAIRTACSALTADAALTASAAPDASTSA